jgi:hypothetical protein
MFKQLLCFLFGHKINLENSEENKNVRSYFDPKFNKNISIYCCKCKIHLIQITYEDIEIKNIKILKNTRIRTD